MYIYVYVCMHVYMNLRFSTYKLCSIKWLCRRPPLIMKYQFVPNGVPPSLKKKKEKKENCDDRRERRSDSLIKIINMAEERTF